MIMVYMRAPVRHKGHRCSLSTKDITNAITIIKTEPVLLDGAVPSNGNSDFILRIIILPNDDLLEDQRNHDIEDSDGDGRQEFHHQIQEGIVLHCILL